MIELRPPLTVTAGQASGLVHHLSAERAQVSWKDHHLIDPSEPILVKSISGLEFKILVAQFSGENREQILFDRRSHHQVMDLLHILRKGQHISLCETLDVEHSKKDHGFDQIDLPIQALPELDWQDLNTETDCLGKVFKAPFLITGMTGGVERAVLINQRLARAAVHHGIPMGVGSQRIALENSDHGKIFQLKKQFPNLFLIGNLGMSQLKQPDFLSLCQRAVDMIEADALAIHVNVLQELVQVEGDRSFSNLIPRIGEVVSKLSVPIIVKEVGAGLDTATARKLWEVGVRNFDVGGSGGTSWAHIEGLRSSNPYVRRRGEVFRNWGLSTKDAVLGLRKALPAATIIGTGGIRNGWTALKAVYIGANMVGVGLPLMRAALENDEEATLLLDSMIEEFKITMMCSGLSPRISNIYNRYL